MFEQETNDELLGLNDSLYDDINHPYEEAFDDTDDEDDYDYEEEDEETSSFDDQVFDMDFSQVTGKDFKKSFGKVNRKIASKSVPRRSAPRPKRPVMQSRPMRSAPRPMAPRGTRPNAPKKYVSQKYNGIAKPIGKRANTPPPRRKKPLNNEIPVKEGKYRLQSPQRKKIAKVIVPDDQKVIIQGASKFILSQKNKDEGIKNIQWYRGEKLKPLILIINNDTPTDFSFELFNPSMPLDYLYSTSQNINDRITVAGGIVSYTDVLNNILANPALVVNAQMATSGPQVANQNNQAMFFKNKTIEGVQTIFPVNLDLQIDNLQVLNEIIYFNINDTINRCFIPDGMDVIAYKVLAGMTVTLCFWYKQVELKKFFYKEARDSKNLL